MDKKTYLAKAIEWAQNRGISSLRVEKEGFDAPKAFRNKGTDDLVKPDLTFTTNGGQKHYTEITLKGGDEQKLVTKLKLLSLLASLKRGKLHLLAPKGHKMFTTNLVKEYNINALVHSI